MKKEIKELRTKIDGLAQLTKELKPIWNTSLTLDENSFVGSGEAEIFLNDATISKLINSKEIDNATQSLYMAKAWLGELLGFIGETTPYKNDGNRKTVEDIEPVAQEHTGIPHLLEKGNWNTDYNHIEKVDFLREEIKETIEQLDPLFSSIRGAVPRTFWLGSFAEKYLIEARFHLGFELQRCKEEK
jgi:hypothetical protein